MKAEWWWLREVRLEEERRARRSRSRVSAFDFAFDEERWLLLLLEWVLLPLCAAVCWLYYMEAWATALDYGSDV